MSAIPLTRSLRFGTPVINPNTRREREEKDGMTPKVGEVWDVKPWWSSDSQTPCKVESQWGKGDDLFDVKPLQGNPHARTVRLDAFISRIGGHPAETV